MLAVQWCAPKTASVVTVSDLMYGLCYLIAVQKLPAVALQCLILAPVLALGSWLFWSRSGHSLSCKFERYLCLCNMSVYQVSHRLSHCAASAGMAESSAGRCTWDPPQ